MAVKERVGIRRDRELGEATAALETALDLMGSLRDEIVDIRDSLEEKFSETERFQMVSEAADALEGAADSLQEASDRTSGIEFGW